MNRKCRFCGKDLPTSKRGDAKVCGEECARRIFSLKLNLARKLGISIAELSDNTVDAKIAEMRDKKCPCCGKPISMDDSRAVYCSVECRITMMNERRKQKGIQQ